MFGIIGWCVAFPLALACEALVVLAALELFGDRDPRPDLLLAAFLVGIAAVAALATGYMLRDVTRAR